ncbi:MAG: TlyA family rRNA (cytidine-2'-O)-methyltransferase [Candidatus Zambryskibacteria bacterium]|nr:TlyA family rRNA (cytidine-2'-O)-methyltransferase [Candidatus Zambryskibacteria bacterium]
MTYVSRAGKKLEYALVSTKFNPSDLICADFGSSTGGFVDCLLQHGAKKVYAIETGYGVLDWKLRTNKNVVIMEKTNAMHVTLPEKVDFISIDTSWTKLENIIPNALNNLTQNGHIIALIKPHYEAEKHMLYRGKLKEEFILDVLNNVREKLRKFQLEILSEIESPILGEKGKNKEFLIYMKGQNRP